MESHHLINSLLKNQNKIPKKEKANDLELSLYTTKAQEQKIKEEISPTKTKENKALNNSSFDNNFNNKENKDINLVKNRKENCNKFGFKKKIKNEKKDYFLDFNIVTKVQNFTFIRKYVENKNDKKNIKKEDKIIENNSNNKGMQNNFNNKDNIIININEDYI